MNVIWWFIHCKNINPYIWQVIFITNFMDHNLAGVKYTFHRFVQNKHKFHSFTSIVWTLISYTLFKYKCHMLIICLFVLFKHGCCMSTHVVYTWMSVTQLSCLNNTWHSCLNFTNLWNNKFHMNSEQTHEAYKFVMCSS